MSSGLTRSAAELREQLGFPVIDTDGHCYEFMPAFNDHLREVAGPDMERRMRQAFSPTGASWYAMDWDERRATRTRRGLWWTFPTKTTQDRAASSLPRLMYERLDELGLDFLIVFPTMGLVLPMIPDDEVRLATIRAMNGFLSDIYAEFSDRIRPVAVIPMHTPDEALAELEFAVRERDMRAIMMPPGVPRPIPALHRTAPQAFPDACWVDHFALDSDHDYDPVWAKCRELKVAPSFHGGMVGYIPWVGRSISSMVYNHTGNMAYQQHALCKALFLGGVSRRFPELNFAFLEGGVGWACLLYADLIGHWEKRSLQGLEYVNPASLDRGLYRELFKKYGGKLIEGRMDQVFSGIDVPEMPADELDEFAALDIESDEDIRRLFAERFYFGCEADDPMTTWSLNTKVNPVGAKLNAIIGSDIGHFDVPEFAAVLGEAYELVEKQLITLEQFKDLISRNAVRLHGQVNPDFFQGTCVEEYAKTVLAGG